MALTDCYWCQYHSFICLWCNCIFNTLGSIKVCIGTAIRNNKKIGYILINKVYIEENSFHSVLLYWLYYYRLLFNIS